MDMGLIIQLVAGVLGGNAAGAVLKNFSLGTVGNSVAGVLGGGLSGLLLSMLGGGAMDTGLTTASTAADAYAAGGMQSISSILGSLASGGVGGGVLMAVVGVVKGMMKK